MPPADLQESLQRHLGRGLRHRTKQVATAVADIIDVLGTLLELVLIGPRLIWAAFRALGALFNL